MAIEVAEQAKPKLKRLDLYIFIISLVLIVLSVNFFISFYLLDRKKGLELDALEAEAAQIEEENAVLEREIRPLKDKIDKFGSILGNHNYSLNFFKFIEENTHQKVQWDHAAFDVTEHRLTLSGNSEDFIVLAQQILVFKNNPEILEFTLSNIRINEEEGGARFSMILGLSPAMFVYPK